MSDDACATDDVPAIQGSSRPTCAARQSKVLRSKSPEIVRQEISRYLLTHYAISALICRAATEADTDPFQLDASGESLLLLLAAAARHDRLDSGSWQAAEIAECTARLAAPWDER